MVRPLARGFLAREFEQRLMRAQTFMRDKMDGIGAVLLTTEQDIGYFSGLESQFWHSPTRPIFLVLPSDGAPRAVVPEIVAETMARTSWLPSENVQTWPAPVPADDGISLLGGVIKDALAGSKHPDRMGLPMSIESQLRMPLADLRSLCASLNVDVVDAIPLTRRSCHSTLHPTSCTPNINLSFMRD